jgi:hypothetical protein
LNQALVDRYRKLCDAIRNDEAILMELSQEPNRPNMICLVRRVNGEVLATPLGAVLTGDVQPFRLTPNFLQQLDPRRN